MTREEAIKELQEDIDLYMPETWVESVDRDTPDGRLITALGMAIKALEQEPILDKIRAEIEQLRLHKAQFLTSDNKVCIDSQEVLNVIDKYKAESEVKERAS